jgi:hypothetical protein
MARANRPTRPFRAAPRCRRVAPARMTSTTPTPVMSRGPRARGAREHPHSAAARAAVESRLSCQPGAPPDSKAAAVLGLRPWERLRSLQSAAWRALAPLRLPGAQAVEAGVRRVPAEPHAAALQHSAGDLAEPPRVALKAARQRGSRGATRRGARAGMVASSTRLAPARVRARPLSRSFVSADVRITGVQLVSPEILTAVVRDAAARVERR